MKENKNQLHSPTEYIPHLAFDSVIFGFNGRELKILVLEYHNTGLFALPGGFVKHNETLDNAVKKGLAVRTGIKDVYLEQFHTFGGLSRFQPEIIKTILEANHISTVENEWMLKRFISVAYYALINFTDVKPTPDALADSIDWYAIDSLPKLMLDHKDIVNKALETLRENLDRKLIGMNLLPNKFTMKDLQLVYEAILGTKIERTAFQRKMLSKDILVRHEKLYSGGAHKAPYLYSFKS